MLRAQDTLSPLQVTPETKRSFIRYKAPTRRADMPMSVGGVLLSKIIRGLREHCEPYTHLSHSDRC